MRGLLALWLLNLSEASLRWSVWVATGYHGKWERPSAGTPSEESCQCPDGWPVKAFKNEDWVHHHSSCPQWRYFTKPPTSEPPPRGPGECSCNNWTSGICEPSVRIHMFWNEKCPVNRAAPTAGEGE